MTDEPITRVLILEDEAVLAFALEDMLIELGYEVVGPALRVAEALQLLRDEQVDAAVLDVNIAGDRSYPVAEVLCQRGIPFLFATGYGKEGVELENIGATVLAKPYRREDIEGALTRLLQYEADG